MIRSAGGRLTSVAERRDADVVKCSVDSALHQVVALAVTHAHKQTNKNFSASQKFVQYATIRYGRLTCAQKLMRWPA